jgi:hypothetical protein
MKANVGGIDRGLRVLAGIGLLAFFALGESGARYIGLVGIVPLLTGLFRFCPLYGILGVNTCPRRA